MKLVGMMVVVAGCVVPPAQQQTQPQYAQQPQYGQQQPQYGQQQPQYAAPMASCQDTLGCYSQCNPMTQPCMSACDQRTSPESQQNAHAVIQCMASSGCQDNNCVAQRCNAQVQACTNVTLAVQQPAASQPVSAPAGQSNEIMQPTYDSYGNLNVPAPRRAITQADLAGEWKNSGKSLKGYVNTSTGGYAGYSAVVAEQQWNVDPNGGLVSKYNGVHASNNGGGTFQVSNDATGTLVIGSDRVITVDMKGDVKQFFLLRGWFVGPELTVMRINGPYYQLDQIDDGTRRDERSGNLDELWVRKTR